MKRWFFILLLVVSSLASAKTGYETKLEKWATSGGAWPKKLEKLYQMHWDYLMSTYPEWASWNGIPGHNDRLTDMSVQAIENRKQEMRTLQRVLQKVPAPRLKGEDAITFGLFKYDVDLRVESFQFPHELLAISQLDGVHQEFPDLLSSQPQLKSKDYQDRLSRLEKLPLLIDQILVLLQEGLKQKVTPPQVVLASLPAQLDAMIDPNMEQNPLYSSFREISIIQDEAQRTQIQNQAKKLIETQAIPAFRKLQTFLKTEYIPQSRQEVAWTALPNGEKWYNYKIKSYTTLDMTADQIHQLGLREVQRIRGEMDVIRQKVGFKKTLKDFDAFLRKDPRFTPKSADELIAGYREISKRIDPELPKLFGRLPRLTYGVRAMPDYKAPSAPAAYYMGGRLEAGRAGYFEANTYDLKARPTWKMEALTLHEAVPGHHLQVALAQEMTGLPEFRKDFGTTAFGEGWGLYSEGLGQELGLYKDPYSKYGQLMMEIWRAIRLVVDTGVHAKGWTREQVMQYFRDNGPFEETDIVAESDRYISWAGQALAYKIGELKFKELRKRSEDRLKERFDVREFHDQALGSGSIPLGVLEAKIDRWIETKSESVKVNQK